MSMTPRVHCLQSRLLLLLIVNLSMAQIERRIKTKFVTTSCNFPVPSNRTDFRRCIYVEEGGASVCDPNHVLGEQHGSELEDFIDRNLIFHSNRVLVAVAILRHIILPDFDVFPSIQKDIIGSEPFCKRLPFLWYLPDQFRWNETTALEYAAFFADNLRQRWFRAERCTAGNNFLILLASEGFKAMKNGRIFSHEPVFSIAFGPELANIFREQRQANLLETAYRCLKNENRADQVLLRTLDEIQETVYKYDHVGLDHNYFIPNWAIYTILGSLCLCVLALLLDWILVSRRVLKSKLVDNETSKWKSGGIIAAMISKRQQTYE